MCGAVGGGGGGGRIVNEHNIIRDFSINVLKLTILLYMTFRCFILYDRTGI